MHCDLYNKKDRNDPFAVDHSDKMFKFWNLLGIPVHTLGKDIVVNFANEWDVLSRLIGFCHIVLKTSHEKRDAEQGLAQE